MKRVRKKRILLLEDDRLFAETLQDFLEEEGYEAEMVFDPLSAFEKCYKNSFDLYIFDINLPFQDGLSAFDELRKSGDATPVIFLTSREDRESLLSGFRVGADDYLKKPVDLEELAARIEVVLRRGAREERRVLGRYVMDRHVRELLLDEKPIHLGRRVYDLLELLVDAKGLIVTREQIKERLWPDSEDASDGALRVYIARLKKLFPDAVENIRGVGYRFDSDRAGGR